MFRQECSCEGRGADVFWFTKAKSRLPNLCHYHKGIPPFTGQSLGSVLQHRSGMHDAILPVRCGLSCEWLGEGASTRFSMETGSNAESFLVINSGRTLCFVCFTAAGRRRANTGRRSHCSRPALPGVAQLPLASRAEKVCVIVCTPHLLVLL